MRIRLLLLVSTVLTALVACHTVPQTGRSALQLVPESQLASAASAQFGQLKQETPISRDPTYNAMVRRVGDRIAYAASPDMPNAQWEYVVFDDDSQVNAFAMPGGKVAVYTGLFKVAKTDDDLAIVIGHEVAHVAARHGGERVSQQLLAAGGALALQIGTNDMNSDERAMIMAAYGAGATLGVLLPYSRYHESEADEIGLIYAAKAGYNPEAAIDFWQRMQEQQSGSVPEFLSTHPSGSTRIARLQRIMPKALLEYERSKN
ncbi:M48 family metallopeptidase [Coraliomargarita parva]|uniref:M48 family metallopeptidase n=1 Tax=Coraliomargarita parva TaxID=3014050 RepID=UPI0022B33C11|nr:M48 family metallopeptidase [Coraliomargarita parva]